MTKLHNAQAKWEQGEHGNRWRFETPEGEVLGILPRALNDQGIADILYLARDWEKNAYAAGERKGAERAKMIAEIEINHLQTIKERLEADNLRLALALEKHINRME